MANHINSWCWDTLNAIDRIICDHLVAISASTIKCEIVLAWIIKSSLHSADCNIVEKFIQQLIAADLFLI